MIVFFIFMFSLFIFPHGRASQWFTQPTWYLPIFILHFLTILWTFALAIFYIIHAYRSEQVNGDKKVIWIILLLVGGMFAMPIYWYLYIWHDEQEPISISNERKALDNEENIHDWTAQERASSGHKREYIPPPEPPNWRG